MEDKISVIIPTYNRFSDLLKAIESVKDQTYKNFEIIIVNDGSTQSEYYDEPFVNRKDIKLINLKQNTKYLFDFPMIPNGVTRNIGIQVSSGDYIAFLDDDDYWMKNKLEIQINEMKKNNIYMSCTDGFIGYGQYNKNNKYPIYNKEYYFNIIKRKYEYNNYKFDDFPDIWKKEFLKIHNCCITSSIMISRNILEKEQFKPINDAEDYDLWLRILDHTDCLYVKNPLFYYQLK
jgi:glycosyltransferase involved in cell wall biosynthesis